MLNQVTVEKMQAMKLGAMVDGFHEQIHSGGYAELSFEERLGMLVDAEWTAREQRKLRRRLQTAKLRYPASFEDIDFKAPRGLDRQVILALGSGSWITEHQNLIISGPTGTGKSFLACALSERACRRGFTAVYRRTSRLLHDLAVARGDGSYGRFLLKLAKVDLLTLDDWLIASLTDAERRDLLEVLEDRYDRRSTLIATQLPIRAWHEAIGEPTVADAICDRLLHRAHRIELKGGSLRKTKPIGKERREGGKGASSPKKPE